MGKRSKEAQARRRDKRNAKLNEKWRVRRETATDSLSTGSRDNHISEDRDLVGDEEG
jgi:hypothetical protein